MPLVHQLWTIGLRWQGIPAEDAALGARPGRRSRAWLLGCLSSEGSSGRALAPFAPDGSMGGWARAHTHVALAQPSPVTLHPGVETGVGLIILVRSLLG